MEVLARRPATILSPAPSAPGDHAIRVALSRKINPTATPNCVDLPTASYAAAETCALSTAHTVRTSVHPTDCSRRRLRPGGPTTPATPGRAVPRRYSRMMGSWSPCPPPGLCSLDHHRHEPADPGNAFRFAKQPPPPESLIGIEVVALDDHRHRHSQFMGLRHDLSLLSVLLNPSVHLSRQAKPWRGG